MTATTHAGDDLEAGLRKARAGDGAVDGDRQDRVVARPRERDRAGQRVQQRDLLLGAQEVVEDRAGQQVACELDGLSGREPVAVARHVAQRQPPGHGRSHQHRRRERTQPGEPVRPAELAHAGRLLGGSGRPGPAGDNGQRLAEPLAVAQPAGERQRSRGVRVGGLEVAQVAAQVAGGELERDGLRGLARVSQRLHLARNETRHTVTVIVTCLGLEHGVDPDVPAPAPGNCPF